MENIDKLFMIIGKTSFLLLIVFIILKIAIFFKDVYFLVKTEKKFPLKRLDDNRKINREDLLMLNDNIEKKLSKINEILDKTECDIHFNLNQIERIKICIETDKEHLSTLRNVVTGKFIEIDEKLKKRGSNANRKRTTTKTA